jgi:hypothetical protein
LLNPLAIPSIWRKAKSYLLASLEMKILF